jgi:hypothetical protein
VDLMKFLLDTLRPPGPLPDRLPCSASGSGHGDWAINEQDYVGKGDRRTWIWICDEIRGQDCLPLQESRFWENNTDI